MPNFWWVNHKQTARQEIDGQYLWSPKVNSNGARNEFYNNMRRATPGDLILSYAEQEIRYVGRVAEFAFTAPKPEEFRDVGANWNSSGWLLPVFWTPLLPPVRPSALLRQIGPLLPKKYSPISPTTGHGYQGVYLAAISEDVFNTMVTHGRFSESALSSGGANSLNHQVVVEFLEDAVERKIEKDTSLDETTRRSVINARRGQGAFRKNVEANERACRLTGITNPTLLRASHIKPWRLCESAEERLDGQNGFMLTPDADLLFDRGFISFEDSGDILVSTRIDDRDLTRLGLEQLTLTRLGEAMAPWRTETFEGRRCTYLDFHRRQVFIS